MKMRSLVVLGMAFLVGCSFNADSKNDTIATSTINQRQQVKKANSISFRKIEDVECKECQDYEGRDGDAGARDRSESKNKKINKDAQEEKVKAEDEEKKWRMEQEEAK